jgi:hypothetical protein
MYTIRGESALDASHRVYRTLFRDRMCAEELGNALVLTRIHKCAVRFLCHEAGRIAICDVGSSLRLTALAYLVQVQL